MTHLTDWIEKKRATFAACWLIVMAALPSAVRAQESCPAPDQPVELVDVRLSDETGDDTVILVVEDPNSADQVTGYNIFRTADPGRPRESWQLVAVDASPESAALPEILLVDPTVQQSDLSYYYVTALNGVCGAQGPRGTSNQGDLDRDGIGSLDDPCPSTPAGAEQLTPGCAASDYILAPEVLTQELQTSVAELVEGSTGDTPPEFVAFAESALLEVELAATRLREAQPCVARSSLSRASSDLQNARAILVDLISTLNGGREPIHGHQHGHGHDRAPQGAGTDGPVEWPSEEVLFLQGQLRSTLIAIDALAASRDIADPICWAQGDSPFLEGIVHEVSDDGQQITLTTGEQIVVPFNAGAFDDVIVTEDTEMLARTRAYGTVYVAIEYQILPTGITIIPGPLAEDCVRMRVLPVQPTPGNALGWLRHRFDGYEGSGGRLELEAGMRLMAEEFNCPAVVPGGGPNGQNLRFDHYYRLRISYQPKTGSYITNKMLAPQLRGNNHVALPPTDPNQDAVIEVTRLTRSCLETAATAPIFDHLGNPVGTKTIWNCSDEEVVDQQTLTARIRDPQAYCAVDFWDDVFEIEDHQPDQWQPTFVHDVVAQAGAPTPLTFSAIGERIVNGVPAHGSAVGSSEFFAIYGRNGHHRWGHGTNNASGLDWPHVIGERNGEPFRYTCSVPALVRDRVDECATTPDTFYRMPYPGGTLVTVTQGNGGSTSHNSWQQFALDLTGNNGNELRAARGGKVVSLRRSMTLNCITDTCTNWGFPLFDEYGNHIAVQHEDGTVGWYAHLVQYSAPLFVGQEIDRGQFIGQMGNTGNSTGIYLHLHTTPQDPSTWGNTTVPMAYESLDSDGAGVQTCFVPGQGASVVSTNR